MRAIVLGLAERAILEKEGAFFSFRPGVDDEPVPCESWEVARLLTVGGRRRYLDSASLEDVKRSVVALGRQEEALDLFLMLFDGDCDEDLRLEAAEELELLLKDEATLVGLEGVVYALPIPESADFVQARTSIGDHTPHVRALLEPLLDAQDRIARVRTAWVQACEQVKGSADWCGHALALAHEHGLFPRLVRAVADDTLWKKTLFDLYALNLPRFRPLITQWTKILQADGSVPKKRAARVSTESEEPEKRPSSPKKRAASPKNPLQDVEKFKEAFKQSIMRGNDGEAEQVLDHLLYFHENVGHSGKHKQGGGLFAAKSLCDLAMFCKRQGRYDWQLRLSEQAILQNPKDAQTWIHKAEALVGHSRLDEALAAYDAVIQEFPRDVVSRTGRAEVLKSLNRLDDALMAYDAVIQEFPGNEVAKNGRAEVLKSLNRLDDALLAYDAVIQEFPGDVVSRTGRAEVLKSLNRLDDALAAYDAAIQEFPGDEVARNGKASVLVLQGKDQEAVALLSHVAGVARTNEDWIARHIVGMIYVRSGRWEEAESVFIEGFDHGPPFNKDYFRLGLASVRLRRGRYEEASDLLSPIHTPKLMTSAKVLTLHAQCATQQQEAAQETLRSLQGTLPGLCSQLPNAIWNYFFPGNPANEETLEQICQQEIHCQLAAA
ncbi:MAG: tetratricopeptide repeat protein [Magnetococcus sp. THC-1_WYH]